MAPGNQAMRNRNKVKKFIIIVMLYLPSILEKTIQEWSKLNEKKILENSSRYLHQGGMEHIRLQ